MLSALIQTERSYWAVLLSEQPIDQKLVPNGPLVLVSDRRKFPAPTTDRDRTVSRRSEPSSRATLMGEQPNPWDLLQPQDVTSRHRGAKPFRRYELLGSFPRAHIDGMVWHLDVGSSHPGAGEGPKGWAVRPLKWHASWVQNVVRQFGPYLLWAQEICDGLTLVREDRLARASGRWVVPTGALPSSY